MLQPLNPLAQAATKLGRTGPSALDVGYKRLGMEQAADMASAKLASARDKVDAQKQATAQKMNAPLLKATVMQFHQDAWNKDVNDYYDWWANAQAAYSKGAGPDPVESGEAARRINLLLQKAANSKTLEDNWKAQHEAVTKAEAEQSGAFAGNAHELIDQEFSKPEYYASGQVPKSIRGMWDWEGNIKNAVSLIPQSQKSSAGPSSDGGAFSRDVAFTNQADVRMAAETLAAKPGAMEEAQMRYDAMDDNKKQQVEALRQKHKMSFTGAMLYDDMLSKTSGVKETERYAQANSFSGGRAAQKNAINWVLEVLNGMESGDIETLTARGINPFSGDPRSKPTDSISMFNDFVINKRSAMVGAKGEEKKVESNDVITNTKYDPATQEWTFEWENDATGDTGRIRAPKTQVDSEIIPELVGLNEERLKGMGAYGTAMEMLQEGNVKGSNAERMRKSQQGEPQGQVGKKWGQRASGTNTYKYN